MPRIAVDYMASVARDRWDDYVVQACAAGKGTLEKLIKVTETSNTNMLIENLHRLVRKKRLAYLYQGGPGGVDMWVPCCPHCKEPFTVVRGIPQH